MRLTMRKDESKNGEEKDLKLRIKMKVKDEKENEPKLKQRVIIKKNEDGHER